MSKIGKPVIKDLLINMMVVIVLLGSGLYAMESNMQRIASCSFRSPVRIKVVRDLYTFHHGRFGLMEKAIPVSDKEWAADFTKMSKSRLDAVSADIVGGGVKKQLIALRQSLSLVSKASPARK